MTTDNNGILKGLDLNEVRSGLSFTYRPNSGLGIGLSIARAITEKHGGTIKAQTTQNGRLKIRCSLCC